MMNKINFAKSIRGLLLIPGHKLELISQAKNAGIVNVVIDLEDSVPDTEKENARVQVIDYFKNTHDSNNIVCGLRINSMRTYNGLRDILGIIEANIAPDYVMYPKSEFASELIALDELFKFKMPFIVLIETARGVANSTEIALASPNVQGLAIGGGDLARNLGAFSNWESMLYTRNVVINAAATAQIAIIDMAFAGLANDKVNILAETIKVKNLGFTGKVALNTTQALAINHAFTPDKYMLGFAAKAIKEFKKSHGNLCLVDGMLIDEHIFKTSTEMLDEYGSADSKNL